MTVALKQLRQSLMERTESHPYLNGEMITTPWDLPDGRTVDLYVERLKEDTYLVSDRELTADRLLDAGVDISRKGPARSWKMLKDGLYAPLSGVSPYEIAAACDRTGLGALVTLIASRVLEGDALRFLARPNKQELFSERAMATASQMGIGVMKGGEIANRYGGKRHVTFRAQGSGPVRYVMALKRVTGSFTQEHDRAKLAFDDALAPRDSRVSLVEADAQLLDWHRQSLNSVSLVVDESDATRLWENLAA